MTSFQEKRVVSVFGYEIYLRSCSSKEMENELEDYEGTDEGDRELISGTEVFIKIFRS